MRRSLLILALIIAMVPAGAQELGFKVGAASDLSYVVDAGVEYTQYCFKLSDKTRIGFGAELTFSRAATNHTTTYTGDKYWEYMNGLTIPVFLRARHNFNPVFFLQADAGYRVPVISFESVKGGSTLYPAWGQNHGPFVNVEAGFPIEGKYIVRVGTGVQIYSRGEKEQTAPMASSYRQFTSASPLLFVGLSIPLNKK